MEEKKRLWISKIDSGLGKAKAQDGHNAFQEWQVDNFVRTMCLDTTASNTGRSVEACIILEQILKKHLVH